MVQYGNQINKKTSKNEKKKCETGVLRISIPAK